MPARSLAQLRWVNSPAGHRALGEAGVREWNEATKGRSLPERIGDVKKKRNWISGAVKHPGALTEAAKEHGRSKLEEAEVESHSSNPHIRSRGILGERFIRKGIPK